MKGSVGLLDIVFLLYLSFHLLCYTFALFAKTKKIKLYWRGDDAGASV